MESSVCIPHDFYVTNATAISNILLRFRSKNNGNYFISSSFLMKHSADYATYRALSPVCLPSLISGLVSSNTSTNLFVKIYEDRRQPEHYQNWILRTGSSKCLKKLDHQSNSCKKAGDRTL